MSLLVELPDERATEAFAARAARAVPDRGEPLVLYLHGELGTGKTCVARGMLREMGDAFEHAAAEYPVLLLLEDIQWLDASSVELISYLGGRIARQRMLVVATLRDANLDATNPHLKRALLDLMVLKHCHRVALKPLQPESVAAYLAASFVPHAFPPDLATPAAQLAADRDRSLALLMNSRLGPFVLLVGD